MPPMDVKDWWLAAAAATSVVALPSDAVTQAGERVGVVMAARPTIKSVSHDRVLYVGNDIQFGERLATDASGALHILFMDQSSITLGPNTAMTIDKFVFDPEKKAGHIEVSLLKGALRVVGGLISKFDDTQVKTANGTIGIRGGITIAQADENKTLGVFLFGQHMQFTGAKGSPQKVTRPGFGILGGPDGAAAPFRIPGKQYADLLALFESRINPKSEGQIFTPRGHLVSTEDRPSGTDTPDVSLAHDRIDHALLGITTRDADASLSKVLGPNGTNPRRS